jgi:IstB-like ATP binding protein
MMIHPTIATLRRLRLTGMAKALEEQQGLPECDRLSFDERLAMLVDREAIERDNAALAVAGDQNPRELGEITLRATGIGLSR